MVDSSRGRPRGAWGALLLALSVTMPAVGRSAPTPLDVPATRPEDRAIFDAAATRKSIGLVDAAAKSEPWTPALADAVALEAQLPGYLRDNYKNRGKEPLWKRAPGYKRQYLGIAQHGRRVIHANFFCHVPASRAGDWQTVAVIVDDGGDCYFQVEYDVKTGTFRNLMVNGEA
jgi:hypothetical protein